MSTTKNSFRVHTGAPSGLFSFDQKYREDQVNQMFDKELAVLQMNFLPGLILQDNSGILYRPRLVVKLEPTHLPTMQEVP